MQEILPIAGIIVKQNQALSEKCCTLMEELDCDYQAMINDKIAADNNLYKMSL